MGFGPFLRFLGLAAVLFVVWLLVSGRYDLPYLLTIGVLSALAVAGFGLLPGRADREARPIELTFAGVMDRLRLIKEVLVSPVQVIVLHPRLPISRMVNGGGSTAWARKRSWQVASDPG